MNENTFFYVIVPLLNESSNVERLIQSFRELNYLLSKDFNTEYIIVDDGSIDDTSTIAKQLSQDLNLIVLNHEKNMGPGYAFGTAFKYLGARLKPDDWIVTMEGDNTSRHELLQQMLIRTREGYDVVLASPYMYGGGIINTSPWRMFLSHIANAFIKEALGIHGILTMSSFYRLYHASVIIKLQSCYGARIIERKGFESMIELLLKMIYLEFKITEVPMLLDTSRRMGKSKMKILRTIFRYLTIWTDKNRWRKTIISIQLK